MTPELRQIIEDAYEVFDRPKPDDPCVCTGCCMDAQLAATFFDPAPRSLSKHQLDEWFEAALVKSLPQDTWAYMLPRILERLADTGDGAPVATEVTLERYPTGQSALWNASEWDVLERFQKAFLRATCEDRYNAIDDVLCMFALAGWSCDDLFMQVLDLEPELLIPKLERDWWTRIGHPAVWVTAFWTKQHDPKAFWYSSQLSDLIVTVAVTHKDNHLAEQAMNLSKALPLRPGPYPFENSIPK